MVDRQEESPFLPNERLPRYPKDLVHRYGAKAGHLLYVAKMLPDIPQAPMLVSEPAEPISDLVARVDASSLGWPRYYRSSSVVELLGYDGDFPTKFIRDSFDQARQGSTIEEVRYSPKYVRQRGDVKLPDKINVIIAEQSGSRYKGTYLRLPNTDNSYFASTTDLAGRKNDYVITPGEETRLVNRWNDHTFDTTRKVRSALDNAASWHDRITSLPDMDSSWGYLVEFGMEPMCLYQITPFKPLEMASFEIDDPNNHPEAVVIGLTPPEGVVVRVVDRVSNGADLAEIITASAEPVLFSADVEYAAAADGIPNIQIAALDHASGLLGHGPVKIMRDVPLTVFNAFDFDDGDLVRVTSDGINLKVEIVA